MAIPSNARLVYKAFCVVLMAAAFLRGNYLLGPRFGVTFTLITLGLLWLLARSFKHPEKPAFYRAVVIAALFIPVGFTLTFPTALNSDLQYFIDGRATELAVRKELAVVFDSDAAFGELTISTSHRKIFIATIQGSLNDQAEFDKLRNRITDECSEVKLEMLSWNILLSEHGDRIEGYDARLFESDE